MSKFHFTSRLVFPSDCHQTTVATTGTQIIEAIAINHPKA